MLTPRHSKGPTSQRHRRDGLDRKGIGGLSEPPSDRLLLPSLDRSWGYGSRSALPRRTAPRATSIAVLRRAPKGKDSPASPTPPSSTRSLPFIASATANDSARGLGHGRADEQLRVAWDRDATALPSPSWSPLRSRVLSFPLRPSSVFDQSVHTSVAHMIT
ncbi:hypothetical protein PRIPAC_92639 [Pristionchus pacificus]|uniref:Uncharacterized protein n=1 Tax=Pristionchus pacificus TaxID=54126 RepID=A0A2A6CHF9_PRIPA|nr:hypothetical protein PRIPAC_92639 [Pristionchus pacificus]|eukprot:PDM77569.1 hypothetical protein PRIPAC_34436 [Pristionchus pacificus]